MVRPDPTDPDRRHTFPKSHRLKRRRLIRSLFDRSRDDVRTVADGTIRLLARVVDREQIGHDVPLQVGFAPGRRVDSGVERNRVRRLLREVYRVHQHTLVDLFVSRPDALILMILFRGNPARADDIHDDLPDAMTQMATILQSALDDTSPNTDNP
ncbi:MAG: ribonuclease P [Bacteroidetes bacterium SW_9_63_38]|nr:MAG: ribonuclease P [Bacteroidetes bacterium SW_9_63_38]